MAEVAGREREGMTEEVNEQVDEERAEEEGNKSDGEDPEAKRARTCTPTTGTS